MSVCVRTYVCVRVCVCVCVCVCVRVYVIEYLCSVTITSTSFIKQIAEMLLAVCWKPEFEPN